MRHATITILGLLALSVCAGCSESMADRTSYVPPEPRDASAVDPFTPSDCNNPDCVCDNCDCDPCQCGADNPEPVAMDGHTMICGDCAGSGVDPDDYDGPCPACDGKGYFPVPQPQSSASMRPGYTLSLLTADWCVNCPKAKTAAYEASVPVELVDVDRDAPRAAELLAGCPYVRSFPMWVLSRDGRPAQWWVGACDAASVEAMAASDPPPSPAQGARSHHAQPVRQYRQPVQYHYQQPMRVGPVRRFLGVGGCVNSRCR